ncbi:hypothetical protein B0J15DRAFT_468202 [Fusarium solani]|uniref:Uncharacterized protein n=1 Tax=Fusarium solani TaxID=169388 RepID=A0A9P9H0K7_FUSSL|nr:uncharacterized protein B0J15DRAFT_468202 [Fusarium solani]KAH7248168.1 hypothetical protein B0J15DRAFT_468202 [Fusarium solani]
MAFTTYYPCLLIIEYTGCCLLLVEIAVLLVIFFGVPGATGYFAWFTYQCLQPQMSDDTQPTRQVFAFLIFPTIFLTGVIWGTVRWYSIKKAFSQQTRLSVFATFWLISIAHTVSSFWTAHVAWGWRHELGSVDFARHC